MSKPLLFKELRETWWMGLAAAVVVLCIVVDAMGVGIGSNWRLQWRPLRYSPFLSPDFSITIGTTAIFLGTALGLWQTMAESVAGTWSYLLHRPVSPRQVVATKALAGTAVFLVGIGLPLLMYLLWALSGGHGAPFELWMTEDTLRLWMTGFVAYLTAFLCGIRTARIYVSRLWPAVPGLLIIAAQLELEAFPTVAWWLTFIGAGLLLPAIFFAAEHRDYA